MSGVRVPSITDEEIIRRYAKRFPGYKLVDYDRVALPIFRIQVRLLKVVKKKIPPIAEFTLRAIDAGLTHADDISGFLGLERSVINEVLADLMAKENVVLSGVEGDRSHRLMLTSQGKLNSVALTMEVPEEEIFSFLIDGLTRRLVQDRDLQPIHPMEVRKAGLREIAPYPRARPQLEEFRDDVFNSWDRQGQDFDLIELMGIQRSDALFRDDAFLLVFASEEISEDSANKTQAGFVVGGHWSDQHADAFRRSNADSRIPLLPEQFGEPETIVSTVLSQDILEAAAPPEETASLREEAERSEERIRQVQEQIEQTTSASERSALEEQLRHEQAKRAEAEAMLASIPVRQVAVLEHAGLLDNAITTAKERVMIIAPWVRRAVVNERFLRKIEDALKRGVNFYIGYGIKNDDESNDPDALDGLYDLADKYDNLNLAEIGFTHEKVLVCDNRFVVIGSFNWLSFRGDPNRRLRRERSVYLGIEEQVESAFQFYIPDFDTPA
jgi:hypothetical protein